MSNPDYARISSRLAMKKLILKDLIKTFDANEIHEACENLHFSTSWESFDEELKTYEMTDLELLYEELEKNL